MKIGILTYHHPENRNYGAMLQLYALYNVIQSLGHQPYVINYIFPQRRGKSIKEKVKTVLIRWVSTYPFSSFSSKFLKNKTKAVDKTNIAELNNDLDVFIVGSDQVWRYSYVPDIQNFFLDFVDSRHKKISYAASFGKEEFDEAPASIIENVPQLLSRFDSVSVRELSGIKICKGFGVDSIQVLDPVFLLNYANYNQLLSTKQTKPNENTIVKMFLDEIYDKQLTKSVDDVIDRFATAHLFKTIDLNGKRFLFTNIFIKLSISSWLQQIKGGDIIITDSFHCVAFCIIFKKKFICLPNYTRGVSRLQSLLKQLNLEAHICKELSEEKIQYYIQKDIDYNQVAEKMEALKLGSINFLKNAI